MLTCLGRSQRGNLCVDGSDPRRIVLFDGLKTFRRVPFQGLCQLSRHQDEASDVEHSDLGRSIYRSL